MVNAGRGLLMPLAAHSPEGQDDQPGDDEDDGKDDEDVVAGVFPARVVEHLGRLHRQPPRVMAGPQPSQARSHGHPSSCTGSVPLPTPGKDRETGEPGPGAPG